MWLPNLRGSVDRRIVDSFADSMDIISMNLRSDVKNSLELRLRAEVISTELRKVLWDSPRTINVVRKPTLHPLVSRLRVCGDKAECPIWFELEKVIPGEGLVSTSTSECNYIALPLRGFTYDSKLRRWQFPELLDREGTCIILNKWLEQKLFSVRDHQQTKSYTVQETLAIIANTLGAHAQVKDSKKFTLRDVSTVNHNRLTYGHVTVMHVAEYLLEQYLVSWQLCPDEWSRLRIRRPICNPVRRLWRKPLPEEQPLLFPQDTFLLTGINPFKLEPQHIRREVVVEAA